MLRSLSATVLALALASAGCDDSGSAPSDAGGDAGAALDAGPAIVVASVVDLGALPLPSDAVAGRDGASSGVIGGRMLWTFGDTFLYTPTPVDGSHVASATGGWAPVEAPLELTHSVDADGVPTQLVPYTDEELAENRADALNGWSLWPGALIDTGAPELLLLFQRIERIEGSGFEGRGLGTARIGLDETVARRDPDDLFSRPADGSGEPLYGVGGVTVEGEWAYFFACESARGCTLGRAPRAEADRREAFTFFDGAGWSAEIDDAVPVIRGVAAALSVVWNEHLGGYLAIHGRLLSDDVVLRVAPRIEGPWPDRGVVIAPSEGGILAAGEGFDYLAQEHRALQGEGGRSVVISYSRPLGSFRGEVRLARITFE